MPEKPEDEPNASTAAMITLQAELVVHRLYLTQLVCYVAGTTGQAADYVSALYANMTNDLSDIKLPGLNAAAQLLVRESMQKFNRQIYNTALNTVNDPKNPAAHVPPPVAN